MQIRELAYVLVGAPTVEEWRRFATGVVAAMTSTTNEGVLRIKIDERGLVVWQDDALAVRSSL